LKVGSGRDGDVDEDEDEAIIEEEPGKLAAVIFRGQSIKYITKILAPGHCDQEWIQSCYALWNRGSCFPLGY
jgi:hypothetical protein